MVEKKEVIEEVKVKTKKEVVKTYEDEKIEKIKKLSERMKLINQSNQLKRK